MNERSVEARAQAALDAAAEQRAAGRQSAGTSLVTRTRWIGGLAIALAATLALALPPILSTHDGPEIVVLAPAA